MIIDGHLDIAYDVMVGGRDFTASVAANRAREGGPHPHLGSCTLALPDLLRGGVGLVCATLFTMPASSQAIDLPVEQSYSSAEQAHAQALAQLALYQRLAERDDVRIVRGRADLAAVQERWAEGRPQLGMVLLMENADPIRTPAEAAWWYEQGVRIVGPAWQATRYCGGTGAPGPLTADGRALMGELARCGMVLDTSHLAEESFWQALELFDGPLIASHSNCRSFVSAARADRHLSDAMIRALIERDAVIGAVLYNAFIVADYYKNMPKERVGLADLIRHIDHICQIAGNTRHVAIGSDLDGGLGRDEIPRELDSVADLALIGEALVAKGYSEADAAALLGGNWLRMLEASLPE
jgi:membrane dipeptidase